MRSPMTACAVLFSSPPRRVLATSLERDVAAVSAGKLAANVVNLSPVFRSLPFPTIVATYHVSVTPWPSGKASNRAVVIAKTDQGDRQTRSGGNERRRFSGNVELMCIGNGAPVGLTGNGSYLPTVRMETGVVQVEPGSAVDRWRAMVYVCWVAVGLIFDGGGPRQQT